MTTIKIAQVKSGNVKANINYEDVISFINENSPKSIEIFDKVLATVEKEQRRVVDLGFQDLVVTLNVTIESLREIDMVVKFSYDNGRKNRIINGRNNVSYIIDMPEYSNYHYGFIIFREEWINNSEATKQTIDNLDAFKHYIGNALGEAKTINKIEILEAENIKLKNEVEELKVKLDFLTSINGEDEEEDDDEA